MYRTLLSIAVAVLAFCAASLTAPSLARAQGPTDFLRRLDANGNGMLDPAETQGRMGEFIKRMAASNPRLDISRPISIDRLASEFQRMREERMQGGGGPGGMRGGPGGTRGGPGSTRGGPGGTRGGPGGTRGGSQSGRGGDPNQRGNQRGDDPYAYRPTDVEPLVPRFGEEDVYTPPLGFGAEGELFTVEVTEEDRKAAERSFQYYDRNRDGKVDSEEMKRSRYGSDLKLYDRNRDGNITLNEMQYRYARRRIDNEGSQPRRASRDSRRDDSEESKWSVREDERASYRIRPVIERLPEGLPDWFARNDADGDGQIKMSEFASSWSDSVLKEFNGYDMNGDGLITPQECLKATAAGVMRGEYEVASTGDSGGTEEESGESSGGESEGGRAATQTPAPSSSIRIDPRYMAYYQKLIAKYDENGDGHLGPSEWSKMSKNPEAADKDGNKLISVQEYAIWSMQQ